MPDKKAFLKWFANYTIGKGGIVFILLAVTLLPLLVLSFYNHPCNDDYAVANMVIQNGFLGAQKYFYLNWTGRYFAVILISLGPLEFNVYWAYKLGAIVFLLLLLNTIYWLTGQLFKKADKTVKIGIASLFFFTCIMRMPDLASGVFWKASSYTCLTADAMTFFLLGCIINYFHSVHKKRNFILSCLLSIAIIGCYEINLVYIDLFVSLIVFFCILKKRPLFFPLFLLAVCIIFSIISIAAPGNSIRGSDYPNAHKLLFSIKESAVWDKFFLIHWLPFVLLMSFLLFDFLSESDVWNKATDSIFTIPPWLSFIICLAIPFMGLLVCFWAEGELPPLRAVNVLYFYFIAGMMYFSFSLIGRIKKRYPDFSFPVYIKLPLYLMLVYLLIFRTNNINVAYNDIISGTASAYNKERVERQEFLTSYKGDSCMIDSIKDVPKSLVFVELPRDRNSWINTSFWKYYHKKYIRIKGR